MNDPRNGLLRAPCSASACILCSRLGEQQLAARILDRPALFPTFASHLHEPVTQTPNLNRNTTNHQRRNVRDMSTSHGVWVPHLDEYGRRCWANSATGQRSYQIPGGSPHVSPQQGPMQPLQYGTPPQLGLTPPFLAQGIAGVAPMPPPLTLGQSFNPTSLPGRKWEELYDSWGNKYWVNKVTRQSTNVDPYF